MAVGRRRIHQPKHPLPPRVYEKGGKFWFVPKPRDRDRFGGKTWIDLGTDYAGALLRHVQLLKSDRDTLEAVWTLYQVRALPGNREVTRKDKRRYWASLKPVFGHCLPDDVEQTDLYDYQALRAPGGRGAVQCNRELALLSHLYTKAVKWRMAARNPCIGVERLQEGSRPKVYVTNATLRAWLDFAPRKIALYTELEYLLGQRCGDVLRLRLSQLHDDGIHVQAAKTGKSAIYPWTEDLHAVVDELKALRVNSRGATFGPGIPDYLILTRRGRPYSKAGFDSIWQRHMVKFAELGNERFAPSDMRAKHASDLEDTGGDATRNLQHSSRQVTARHYLRKPARLVSLERVCKKSTTETELDEAGKGH